MGNSHCWIESDEGWVIDLTHKQFGDPDVLVASPERASTLRYTSNVIIDRDLEDKCRNELKPSLRDLPKGPWIAIGSTGLKELMR